MSEPLDLEPYRQRDEQYSANPYWNEHPYSIAADRHALLAEVDRLREHDKEVYRRGYADGCNDAKMRAEIADRANVEADLRAQLAGTRARAEVLDRQFDAFQSALIDTLPVAEPDWEPAEIVAAVRGLAGERCPDCGLWHRAPDVS